MTVSMKGTMSAEDAAQILRSMRWVGVPSPHKSPVFYELCSKYKDTAVMFGRLAVFSTHCVLSYTAKPIGKKVTLLLKEPSEFEARQLFDHMVRLGLVAAVFYQQSDKPLNIPQAVGSEGLRPK